MTIYVLTKAGYDAEEEAEKRRTEQEEERAAFDRGQVDPEADSFQ